MNALLLKLRDLLERLKTLLLKQKAEQAVVSPINVEPPPPVHASQMWNLAYGIFEAEGGSKAAGFHVNNRGDLKYTDYTKSLGATGATPMNFAIFPTMDIGDQACVQLCVDAATNKLKAFQGTMTLKKFCQIYALPPNDNYLNVVLKHITRLGITSQSQLRELL